ncbi:PREDICTED: serine/threonine-protein kinase-like protein At5g23170 [Ipomoea nil]|uniref:serine/threonine-protein kinase-like protein At5g23170 n=1 Tax=Ipomoea nil TaxID=35883 RepID=UPI0009015D92|nr:PREDICTED: serine/threonine-protein kinase-like protein At5g23170 [Ipomoea nil]
MGMTGYYGYDYEELKEAAENFSDSRLIGKGSHGCVYKAFLKHGVTVAIKKPSLAFQKLADNSNLENEARILSSLPPCPYVVKLLGTSRDSAAENGVVLVMEHLPNGTLHDALHAPSATPPAWLRRARIAIRVAKALRFLHGRSPPVVHRDVKSANILFDASWDAKLADFGLAIGDVDDESLLSRPAGTIGYLDPCYTVPSNLSTKNDVFSFGVVLLEMISCRKVIDVTRSPASIVEWASHLIRHGRPLDICDKRVHVPWYMEHTIRQILGVASRCVSPELENRPSMEEIVTELENCILEPARFPLWVNILRTVTLLTRQRKMNSSRRKRGVHGDADISRGEKVLFRQILADTTLE